MSVIESRGKLSEPGCLPVRGNAAWSARAVRRHPRRYPGRSLDPGSYRWTRAPRELPQMSRVVVAIDPSGTRGPGRATQNDANRKTAAFEVRHMRSLGKTPAISRPTRAGRPTRQKILLHSRRLASSAPIATACAGYPGKPQDHAAAAQRLRSVGPAGSGAQGLPGAFLAV
jgi:hypothetical protein